MGSAERQHHSSLNHALAIGKALEVDGQVDYMATPDNRGSHVRKVATRLKGRCYHEPPPKVREIGIGDQQKDHCCRTAEVTDHVFALCHLLGFRFAPRIRDLADKRLYPVQKPGTYPALEGLVGGVLNTKLIGSHGEEILRLYSFATTCNALVTHCVATRAPR